MFAREACRPRSRYPSGAIAPARGGLMHPGFIPHWNRQRCGESRVGAGYGPEERRAWRRAWEYEMAGEDDPGSPGFVGAAFGVRRPLRFLAYKLHLEDA